MGEVTFKSRNILYPIYICVDYDELALYLSNFVFSNTPKAPLPSEEVRWGFIGFLLLEVSAGAKTERSITACHLI